MFWRVALAARFWAWPVCLSDGVPEFEEVVTAFVVVVAVVCIDELVAEGVTVDDVVLAASVLADWFVGVALRVFGVLADE